MSTHNICFCQDIRKIKILFVLKKRLIKNKYGKDLRCLTLKDKYSTCTYNLFQTIIKLHRNDQHHEE